MESSVLPEQDFASVNRAFSKQSVHYDADDARNQILLAWRQQVYAHLERYIQPKSKVLELNSGTGIDAIYLANKGHKVHCTDLSDGMIQRIREKVERFGLRDQITFQQCSFEQLNEVEEIFDHVFSNFGGLNCTNDLSKVTRNLTARIKQGGFVTWVIMPPVCPWEISWMFKGHLRSAFRRLQKSGTRSHLEGEFFKTYYHSLHSIAKCLGPDYDLLSCEGLGALSPPPSAAYFPEKHPGLYPFLLRLDKMVRNVFPFNRWADHIIVTFQRK